MYLSATESCSPSGDACNAPTDSTIYASKRADLYYGDSEYNEAGAYPTYGRRYHFVGRAAVTGTVTSVKIEGSDADSLLASGDITWCHVYPQSAVSGAPIWVMFHSLSSTIDSWNTIDIEVNTTGGKAIDGNNISVDVADVILTSVTTSTDYKKWIIHLKNDSGSSKTLTNLIINGKDVTSNACIPNSTIEDGKTALWTVDISNCAVSQGDAWTVVAKFSGSSKPSVAAGRVIPAHFPISTWPRYEDCSITAPNAEPLFAAGFDTVFANGGSWEYCGKTRSQVQSAFATQTPEVYLILAYWGEGDPPNNGDGILAVQVGDEADSSGYENAQVIAAYSKDSWAEFPAVPTLVGASRNRRVGGYAGTADIQAMDLYPTGGAPVPLEWPDKPGLNGSYDYLRLTRANHMPNPTWHYSQLFGNWRSYPDATEATILAAGAIAAGGKGLMYFQTYISETSHANWSAISTFNKQIRGIREFLRTGEPMGISAPSNMTADVIRSERALILIVTHKNGTRFRDHFRLTQTTNNISFDVPNDFSIYEYFRIHFGATQDITNVSKSGRTITVSGLTVETSDPLKTFRIFVFAADAGVRGEIENNMNFVSKSCSSMGDCSSNNCNEGLGTCRLTTATYDQNSQFSGTQGSNNWYYQKYNGSYSDLSNYDSGNQRWYQSGQSFLYIGKDWMHPGDNYDPVKKWVAPYNGSARIIGTINRSNPNGEGVTVSILHNGTSIWFKDLNAGQQTTFDLTRIVNANDSIAFKVNKRGNIVYDYTYFTQKIVLTH